MESFLKKWGSGAPNSPNRTAFDMKIAEQSDRAIGCEVTGENKGNVVLLEQMCGS